MATLYVDVDKVRCISIPIINSPRTFKGTLEAFFFCFHSAFLSYIICGDTFFSLWIGIHLKGKQVRRLRKHLPRPIRGMRCSIYFSHSIPRVRTTGTSEP